MSVPAIVTCLLACTMHPAQEPSLEELERQVENGGLLEATRRLQSEPQPGPDRLTYLAYLQYQRGDHAGSERTLDRLLARHPDDLDARRRKAMAVWAAGDYRRALALYQDLDRRTPAGSPLRADIDASLRTLQDLSSEVAVLGRQRDRLQWMFATALGVVLVGTGLAIRSATRSRWLSGTSPEP